MKRTLSSVAIGALVLLGCGSDESSVDTVGPTDPPTTEAAAPTTEAAAPTTEAAVDTTVAEAAALIPEAVCRGIDGEVVFGYLNESSEPVLVEEGNGNELSGVASDADPLLTTLFAPGSVEVAFWAFPPEGSDGDVVWTLTGPDGVERTAAGGPMMDTCQGSGFEGGPVLEVVGQSLAADGESVDVELRLTELDETSVCNEAFDAQPRLVVINDGSALPTGFEPEATLNVGPFVGGLAQMTVYAFVLEQCSAEGVTASSWSPELLQLNYGLQVCARVDDAGELAVSLEVGGCGLPGTGGKGLRPR